jgi:hypothetical protein
VILEKQLGLEDIKNAAGLFLQLDDNNVIDVIFAVYTANRLNADPLWLFVVGPPGTAKTELISSMDGHPGVYLLSSLTPKTFISGKTSPTGVVDNFSLLFQLTGKTVVMKDFTTILSQHRDHKSEIFAQLREIYDGRYRKAFGTGQTPDWRGKIGLIAGVTPAIDKQMAVNQLLGERFLYYRMETQNHTDAARMAIERTLGIKDFRLIIKQAAYRFLTEINEIDPTISIADEEFEEPLINLATLCTHARSAVLRDRFDQSLQYLPEPEGPARMVKQLSLLAKALAIVRGQDSVDQAIYEIVKKVARDCLPRLRSKMLDALWGMFTDYLSRFGDPWPWFRTGDIADHAKMPSTTVRNTCEDLMLLGLFERTTEEGKTTHMWQPSKRMVEWAFISQFFFTNNTPPTR